MKKKTRYFMTAAFLGVIFTLFALSATNFVAFKDLELNLLDWRFHLRGEKSVKDNPIVIIAIDDQSYEGIGDVWPWKRDKYAHIISNLNKAGAKVIGIDVIMDIPRYDAPKEDQMLSDTLAKYHNVVLVGKYEINKKSKQLSSAVVPYEKFVHKDSNNPTAWGMVSMATDADGIYRRYLPYQKDYPSFALAVAAKYWGIDPEEFIDTETELNAEKVVIPYLDSKDMLIDFAGPAYTYPYRSFADVIDDETYDLKEDYDLDYFNDLVEEGVFQDKIVLIGATLEELHDNFPTPFLKKRQRNESTGKIEVGELETPGVELHANALENILDGHFYKRFPGITQIWLLIGLSLLIFLITWYGKILYSIPVYLGVTAAYIYASIYVFENDLIWLEMTPAILSFTLVFASTTITGYVLSLQEKREIKGAFAHYVPADVVNDLLANPDKLTLGGEERYMSVIFSDVASFTSVSEKLSPQQLVGLLNEYLSAMTDIVLEHKGIIDKYEGDAIMAEFGAPVYYPDHAQQACRAALRMQEKLVEMRKIWKAEGRDELRARVGINTGNMVVGNMGSREVFDYTVMGDAVNLSSRLEGANKQYGTYIMISEFTYEWVKEEFYTRPLDLITVKGKTKPVGVYEVMGEKGHEVPDYLGDLIARYTLGYGAYLEKNWDSALEHFKKCQELLPDDPPSKVYIERCNNYKQNPPPEDWDGAFVMTTK